MGEIKQLPLDYSLNTIIERIELLEKSHNGGGGNMEARIAKLESSVTHIEKDISIISSDISGIRKEMREDFRIGIGFTIAAILGLAGLIAKGFHWF